MTYNDLHQSTAVASSPETGGKSCALDERSCTSVPVRLSYKLQLFSKLTNEEVKKRKYPTF